MTTLRQREDHIQRGEPIEFEGSFAVDPGSPAPELLFTLAEERDSTTKLITRTVESAGSPAVYSVLLESADTAALDVRTRAYRWDLWRLDNDQPVDRGQLFVHGSVRFP